MSNHRVFCYINHFLGNFVRNFVAFTLAIITSVGGFGNLSAWANDTAHYQSLATQKNLANHPTWQRLFYAHNQQIKDIQYQDFFVSKNGKKDLAGELQETLNQLFADTTERSPQCRFPARSEWLIAQLNINKKQLPTVNCQKFDEWLAQINPHTLTLVFASDYMGNPSSMFGHTLMRLDPPKSAHNTSKNMDLVAYALNYAATTPPNENPALYALKGLTGKYGGEYSLMRYFHKTKEYGDFENRDLWEYELALSPNEVQFLTKHIWEMQQVKFPYYFMDKNCSYALLGLIDLVRPNLNLQSQFGFTVIPIETVKAVKKAGLIRESRYRPSLESHLKAQEKTFGKAVSNLANDLTKPTIDPKTTLSFYPEVVQTQALEMGYDNLSFNQATKGADKAFAQNRLRELLVLRSQINAPKQRPIPAQPANPMDGHGAKMLGVGIGVSQGNPVRTLSHRVAYHDLSDPQAGYNVGRLLFLNGQISIQKLDKKEQVKLDFLDLLSVKSVNPITSYKRPRSWGTHIGYQQVAVDEWGNFSDKTTTGVGVLSAQTGYAKAFFDNRLTCGAYVRGEVQIGKVFANQARLGVSPNLECHWRASDAWQAMASVNTPYWLAQKNWQTQLQGELQYNINNQNAIRFGIAHEQQGDKDWQKALLSFYHYY